MSEFARIARLRKALDTPSPHVELGIGDDAAILRLGDGERLVVSIDSSVENVHFRRAFAPLDRLAERAFLAAASDLSAMGASPHSAFVSLIAPADLDDADFDAITAGVARASRATGLVVAGGNLSRGTELSLTTTVLGAVREYALTRSGARAGDDVFVTGTIGAAALGLAALLKNETQPLTGAFIERWLAPSPRLVEGRTLSGFATSCIDISDGLVQDAAHVAKSSDVRLVIEAARIPLSSFHNEAAAQLGVSALAAALSGGEDYELLFTMPRGSLLPVEATRIGRVDAGDGVLVLDEQGDAIDIARGHDHFV
jgi:thiamine-monophosphate kinase